MRLPSPNRESTVLKGCMQVLEFFRFPHIRMNTGGTKYRNRDGSYRYVKFGMPGMSDLWAVIPISGRTMTIEVKRPIGGKRSTEQVVFRNAIQAAGGIAGFVSDPEVLRNICVKLTEDPWHDVNWMFEVNHDGNIPSS